MPRKRKAEKVAGRYFAWVLRDRGGVWQADGRSNAADAGRHSLGTRDKDEALRLLAELDLAVAVRLGLADPAEARRADAAPLSLEEGRDLYIAHVFRPRVLGGAKASSRKRYESVLAKFLPFAAGRGVPSWNRVTAHLVKEYTAALEAAGRAPRTLYFEALVLKQCQKFLVEEGRLQESAKIRLRLARPQGSDAYCWRKEEVAAMRARCREIPGLGWLGDAVAGLAMTGLRVSELAGLRWPDIDLEGKHPAIVLTDESSRASRAGAAARTTKTGRSRAVPVNQELADVLKAVPRHADGFVFRGPGGGPVLADDVRRALKRELVAPLAARFPSAAGEVGFKDGTPHSFRHYFVSECANSNVPERVVMAWTGHASSEMIRRYYHLKTEEGRRHMDQVRFGDAPGDTAA